VVETLSFWSRKRAAERIGAGELVAVLAWLDRFSRHENEEGRPASLVIVGHSFGGTMVYAALANALKARLVEALEQSGRVPDGENVVRGFGNLVVLINPAFEASAFAPLHDLEAMLGSPSQRQTPVLVVVGSESDSANRVWFPFGRTLETLFARTGSRSDRALLTTAVGRYDPFVTHRLEATETSASGTPTQRVDDCACQLPIGELAADESRRIGDFFRTHHFASAWNDDRIRAECAAGVSLGSARLTCLPGATPTAPVWCVRATDDVVHGHSGFFTRPFLDFLRYLILGGLTSAPPS
jgi:pimeloyl-ACP methyl ester carboxylesterase